MKTSIAAIEDIINSPRWSSISKEEAYEILRKCGILDENNQIIDAYNDIITKTDDSSNDKKSE